MKKFVTIMLVAVVAISALFVLVACSKPLEDKENTYVITGQFAGWGDVIGEDGPKAEYKMTAIATSDKRVKSIKADLKDAKYLYIVEHEFTNNKGEEWVTTENEAGWEAGWSVKYKITEDATEFTEVDGNMAIKVIRAKQETAGGETAWVPAWLPDAGNTNVKSLTPETLYLPPHSEAETYPGSGAWNDNPMVLKAGTYYVVFAEMNDGTFGLGLIAK